MPQRPLSASSVHENDSQRTKPLPRLPRGWSRVCHEMTLFCRSIGLGLIVTVFQGFFVNSFLEPEKVAIRRNRITAFLRALIHALPVGIAIFEIFINWKGRYIGTHANPEYIQFVAKAHEITMQASVTTILLSYIRYQITTNQGLPFGAVLGGLQFLQISYMWSVEFWSSILSKDFQLKRKLCFAALIVICVTVAATAGPSSATLLIARQGLWPTQSSYMYVNATSQAIWPDHLDGQSIPKDCATVTLYNSSLCPSHDFLTVSNGVVFAPPTEVNPIFKGRVSLQTSGRYIKDVIAASCSSSIKEQICATAPHEFLLEGLMDSSVAPPEARLRVMKGGTKDHSLEGYHDIRENYHQPYTVSSCISVLTTNLSDQTALRFPRILEEPGSNKSRELIPVSRLTKADALLLSGNGSDYRVGWVDLPRELFNTEVPGVLIVHPRNVSSPFRISTCTVNAGWGTSGIMTDALFPNWIRSRMVDIPSSLPLRKSALDPYGILLTTAPSFMTTSDFSYPQRRIRISKTWMQFLNPTVLLNDGSRTTGLSTTLLPSQEWDDAQISESISLLVAAGLAITGQGSGFTRILPKRIKPCLIDFANLGAVAFEDPIHNSTSSASCDVCLRFEIKNMLYGWMYTTRETTTRLSIIVMFTYCILVSAHVLYSLISGISSTAWDSFAEVVALAMNSSPTELLQNTCAGIIGRRVFKTPVKIRITTKNHLELIFGDSEDRDLNISRLATNEKYGTLMSGDDCEAEATQENQVGRGDENGEKSVNEHGSHAIRTTY